MKNYLKAAAGIITLAAVSMSLEAVVAENISKDEELPTGSHSQEIAPEINVLNEGVADSAGQSQSSITEAVSPSASELFLEQVRTNSRREAAGAAYNLSIIAASRKDFKSARTLIEEAIQLDPSNVDQLVVAADIAFISREYNKAEAYQLMMLEIGRSTTQLNDLQVATILDKLGAIYVAQERYEDARSSLQEGLQLRRQILGDSHLMVAISLNKLAVLAVRQEQPAVAELLLKRSLDITREVSGERHANCATMLANIADFYQHESRLEEAEAYYKEAISIWTDSPGVPLSRAIVQNSLGQLFMSQRRFGDARAQFEQVLSLLKQNYTQDHPYVLQAIRNLTAVDAELRSNVDAGHMYDVLARELNLQRQPQKSLAATVAPSSNTATP